MVDDTVIIIRQYYRIISKAEKKNVSNLIVTTPDTNTNKRMYSMHFISDNNDS